MVIGFTRQVMLEVDTENTQDPQPFKSRTGEVFLGRYHIKQIVQDGPLSQLYAAVDTTTSKQVLFEVFKTAVGQQSQLFASLAKDSMALSHKNILQLLAYQESPTGYPSFVWEFVDFVRLDDLVETGGFIEQESEIFSTLSQLCSALEYAHERKVVHGYLHPRYVCLADVDGEVQIKVACFGFANLQQQLLNDQTGGPVKPTVPKDVYHLSILTYFIVSGELPVDGKTLDQLLHPMAGQATSFGSLADYRDDLLGYEELIQLLDDSLDADESWRISSAKDFSDGLIDWIESAKSATRKPSAVAEQISADVRTMPVDETGAPIEAPKRKTTKRRITNNMRTTVRQLVSLRTNQSNQEETAVMMLTNLASAKGPRTSPKVAVMRLTAAVAVFLACAGFLAYAIFFNPDEFKSQWVAVSEDVFTFLHPERAEEEKQVAQVHTQAPSGVARKALEFKKDASLETVQGKPRTKLEAFDHNILRDLYRKDFTANNNQTRRRFRIEYREFKQEWIKN